MSLSSLLTKLANVRGAIVGAISSKGVSIASSATLHECASAIQDISAGSGTDVSDTTATAATVLSGYDFYDSAGVKTSGTIPIVVAGESGGAIKVPRGYIPASQSFPLGTDVGSTTAKAYHVLSPMLFFNSGGTLTTGTIQTVSASIKNGAVVVPAGYIPASQSFPLSPPPAEHVSSGVVINEYETATVSSGWDYQSAYIKNGGAMIVSSGGTATDTVIRWNGSMTVYSGGTVRNTKVIDGVLVVSDGGTASDTFMTGGDLYVSSGGTATNTHVVGGSAFFSGGIADGAQIEIYGRIQLISGASGNHILIHSDGRLDIGPAAVVTSVTVSGIVDVSGGASADHIHVCSGGVMYQREGATVTNLVVDDGGSVQ